MKNFLIVATLLLAGFGAKTYAQDRLIFKDVRQPNCFPKPTLKIGFEKSPKWNISGSWSKARNINEVKKHLMADHKLSKSQVDRLSINQLWWLHTQEHERKIKPIPLNLNPPLQSSS